MPKIKVGSPEFIEDAKRFGLTPWEYAQKLRKEGKLPNPTNVEQERKDSLAKKWGYKNFAEYVRESRWNEGIRSPMSENEDCSQYLGIYIGEIVLSDIFDSVARMPNNNHGYDWICKNGYKIDIKTATLDKGTNYWKFNIRYNNIADYFLLVGFDDIHGLNPIHIWLIGKNELIRKRVGNGYIMEKFYKRSGIQIYNDLKSSIYLQRYEWCDKLGKLKNLCESLKATI